MHLALVLIPYPPNENFIDRPDIQNEMRQQFGLGEYQGLSQPRRRVSLCGFGGNGYVFYNTNNVSLLMNIVKHK